LPDIIKNGFVVKLDHAVMIPGRLPVDEDIPEEPTPEEQEEAAAAIEAEVEEKRQAGDEYLKAAREKADAVLQDARMEASRVLEQAREEGFAAALSERREAIDDCIRQVSSLLAGLQQRTEDFLSHYQECFSDMVIEVTAKLIDRRLSQSDEDLRELCRKAVASVKKADWIKVEVSDKLPLLAGKLREELAAADGVEIEAGDLPAGTCLVQTPEGVIDASIETQLANLKKCFSEVEAPEN